MINNALMTYSVKVKFEKYNKIRKISPHENDKIDE